MTWKQIEDFPEYEVSSEGCVRRNNYILKPQLNSKGYLRVSLYHNKKVLVHRLVAKAFISNPENKPQVNHRNGVKTDNRVCNLEWVTNSENQKHGNALGIIKHPVGEAAKNAKLTEQAVRNIKERYKRNSRTDGAFAIAKEYGVSGQTILNIIHGKKWRHVTL